MQDTTTQIAVPTEESQPVFESIHEADNPLPDFDEFSDTPILFYQLLLVMLLAACLLILYYLLPDWFQTISNTLRDVMSQETDFIAWGKDAGDALQTMLQGS